MDNTIPMQNSPLKRYLSAPITEDLKTRKVFLGGPRQVGKTTCALSWLNAKSARHPGYLNWDDVSVRSNLLKGELPGDQKRVVLDEIHKHPGWRNLVKGFYDTNHHHISILVTGSARLDYYRKGGDSLQGRYHYHRLHPFSLTEINSTPNREDFQLLMKFGGFPEPLLRADERNWRRWQKERITRVVHDDIRDLETIKEIGLVELLAEALPERVGSPLSVRNLREDLQVAHETAERWITILENMYVCFRISPYGAARIRAVKKEKKLYMWDWSQVPSAGARFENLVASHLLKYCHHIEDTEGHKMELRFVRDADRREIDFVVLQNRKPVFAVECKSGDTKLSPAIQYFRERTDIPLFYQVHTGSRDYLNQATRILPFHVFCKETGLP